MFKYPSSKYYADLEPFLEEGFDGNLIVPFVGAGMDVIRFLRIHQPNFLWLNDIDIGVTSFWKAVKRYPTTLISKLKRYEPDTANFFQFRDYLSSIDSPPISCQDITDVAMIKVIVHTLSHQFQGVLVGKSIPQKMWANHQISPKQILEAHELLKNTRVRITSWDYNRVLGDQESDGFTYLDPPDLHQEYWNFSINDHWKLSDILYNRDSVRWLITYRDSLTIRKFYSFADIFKYKKELVIANYSRW